jgi:hypothetical protein
LPAPGTILKLVDQFHTHLSTYKSTSYNETQVRREFIDPFFETLGWDIFNRNNLAHAYKDVIHEDALKIAGKHSAPDYAFRIGGRRRFFVEAKKPAINLKDELSPAYQLRRYAWSAKLPLSILTDFEEFSVYDCRIRPGPTDKASTGRLMMLTFDQYPARWDEIAAIFSRAAVCQGSFDQYAETSTGRHGTAEVDDAFLAEIERWRDLLARNIALRNPALSQHDLNYAVQMTIDRLIFLRICEDRGIEFYGRLQSLQTGGDLYPRLCQFFQQADARYNSGLFHFKAEKDQAEAPDGLTPGLTIDDKPLKDILANLYYPESPYEFSVLPADILGQVYEQFLGKVIRLTTGHRAVVEDKPEVKKAGGVYYTPTYIVEYIVKHTLGQLLEDKHPGDMGVGHGAPIRVLDMACGSGSFLIVAYQTLLDWYLNEYILQGAEKWAKGRTPRLAQSSTGDWRLTTAERKRILLEHIYGVDIDLQAVEVTKLSLLLKVLEGESEETVGQQLSMFHERALPNLGQNIKCGNSLIGNDFYTHQQASFLDDDEQRRINAFDWEKEFAGVFASSGGFDVVVGNPPYIRIQALKEWAPREVEFYKQRYTSASKGNYDIYVVFVEKGLSLLNPNGHLGFILPHKFFNAQYGAPLRGILAEGKHLAKVVHFGDKQVFENATTYTCLMFLDKVGQEALEFEKVEDLDTWRVEGSSEPAVTSQVSTIGTIPATTVTSAEWNFNVGKGVGLFEKLSQMPVRLGDLAHRIYQGFKTGADPVFILEERENGLLFSNALNTDVSIETIYLRPLYKSGEMKRYRLHKNTRLVIFPYSNGSLISWSEIKEKAPLTAVYLDKCKEILAKRENGRWIGKQWYCYSRNQALEIISRPKLLTADLNPFANYCFDNTGLACFPGGAAGGYGIVVNDNMYLYILGLLNSKAVDYYHKQISSNYRGGWFGYDAKVIRHIPIRTINFSDPADVQRHAHMVALVERMLNLHRELAAAQTPGEKARLQRQVDATDAQIDALVYELYGLTDEEIKLVEGK